METNPVKLHRPFILFFLLLRPHTSGSTFSWFSPVIVTKNKINTFCGVLPILKFRPHKNCMQAQNFEDLYLLKYWEFLNSGKTGRKSTKKL